MEELSYNYLTTCTNSLLLPTCIPPSMYHPVCHPPSILSIYCSWCTIPPSFLPIFIITSTFSLNIQYCHCFIYPYLCSLVHYYIDFFVPFFLSFLPSIRYNVHYPTLLFHSSKQQIFFVLQMKENDRLANEEANRDREILRKRVESDKLVC